MCFSQKAPDVPDPAPPPEVLKQDAPEKKKAAGNNNRSQTLSIGSKRYRTETGLGTTARKQNLSPSGPSISV